MTRLAAPALTLPPRRGRAVATLGWDRVWIMGVVNATPDSFSDGGRYAAPEAAIAQGIALWRAGADVLDVGGEATNPRARPVEAAVELARVVPVLEGLAAATDAVLSVDTTKASVAAAAVAAGADIINDVAGGRFDPAMFEVATGTGAAYVCGHLRGTQLGDVFAREVPTSWREVVDEQAARLAVMPAALRERCLVDPGLGVGKGDGDGNATLVARTGELAHALGRPVLIGPSRKRFLRRLLADAGIRDGEGREPVAGLDAATVGAALAAAQAGAHMIRTHDVALLRPALAVYTEIERLRCSPVD